MPPELPLLSPPLPGLVRIMHNTFFTRFAAAGVAVAPLTLISALIWIDGSHAGQADGQRERGVAPETTAQTGTPAKRRPSPPQRLADPTQDSLAHGTEALFFGRASDPGLTQARASASAAPADPRGGQDGSTERGRADEWAPGLAPSAHLNTPYGRNWIAAPQAVWNANQPGVSSAFTAPTGGSGGSGTTPGSQNPAGSASIPGNPQLFYAPEDPVAVLTAASPGATPAESSGEAQPLLAAPAIIALDATRRAIPEPSALGLALGALGLAGIGQRSRRGARRTGG